MMPIPASAVFFRTIVNQQFTPGENHDSTSQGRDTPLQSKSPGKDFGGAPAG
jgi:hypothetical protein